MKIEDFVLKRWYFIKDSKIKPEVLIEMIKKRIDWHNDFEFNGTYTKFRRIGPYKPINGSLGVLMEQKDGKVTEIELEDFKK